MVMVGSSTARAMAMARIALLPRTLEPCPSLHRLLLPLPHPRLTLIRFVSASSSSFVLASTATDHSASLLDKLRIRQLRDRRAKSHTPKPPLHKTTNSRKVGSPPLPAHEPPLLASSFKELSLSDELVAAVEELNLTQPTEVQCLAIPAVLDGQSAAIASHTGSGKTLAYMIPLVQRLRQEEMEQGKATRSKRPRAVVLCPTRELAEQVFRVAKSICHHARFRAAMIGGGVRMRPQEDALNSPIDMLVGTPGRMLKHIEEGNMAYGDIKYVVLDEADTMFDRGFGPDVRKFLMPLRNRSCKPEDPGFQTILVTATITKAVQKLLNEEFPGIRHIQTSTLHKKISTARHGFIKLSGTENKLESLLQVLEPSLSKGDRVMVFCNTLNSCRAVDHFLTENGIKTVNYHGAVPAEERVEVLNQFRNEDDKCPALVCTDLAARGLDLVVDHVIMFDFPLNSIDYLHRTGRTARMGAKGKITSLVTKRSLVLAELIEEAIQKGETLEGLSLSKVKTETSRTEAVKFKENRGKTVKSATRATKSSMKKPKAVFSGAKKSPVVRLAKGPMGAKRSPVVRLAKGPMGAKSGAKKVTKTASRKVVKFAIKR